MLRKGVAERGVVHLALTGGSSAIPLYEELARPARRAQLAWENVHFWWGDERYVPLDHPQSNAGLADRLLFAIGPRSGEFGRRWRRRRRGGGRTPRASWSTRKRSCRAGRRSGRRPGRCPAAAAAYAAEIERLLPLDCRRHADLRRHAERHRARRPRHVDFPRQPGAGARCANRDGYSGAPARRATSAACHPFGATPAGRAAGHRDGHRCGQRPTSSAGCLGRSATHSVGRSSALCCPTRVARSTERRPAPASAAARSPTRRARCPTAG